MNLHGWRLLATTEVLLAREDAFDEKRCQEAWDFFDSKEGQLFLEIAYVDAGWALDGLPRPKPMAKKIVRGRKGNPVVAMRGKKMVHYPSISSAAKGTKVADTTVLKCIREKRESRYGWRYEFDG